MLLDIESINGKTEVNAMSKKRMVIGFVLVIVIGLFAAKFIRHGYLPVIGKLVAKSDLEAYTGERLSVVYNSKSDCYEGVDLKGSVYEYDLRTLTIQDEHHSERVQQDLNQQYKAFLKNAAFDSAVFSLMVRASASVNANDHSKQYVWVWLNEIREPVRLNEEESKDRMNEILESFCSNVTYNITSVRYEYANLNGMYEVTFDNGKKPILESCWRDYIEKRSEDGLSPAYMEWREENLAKENK